MRKSKDATGTVMQLVQHKSHDVAALEKQCGEAFDNVLVAARRVANGYLDPANNDRLRAAFYNYDRLLGELVDLDLDIEAETKE